MWLRIASGFSRVLPHSCGMVLPEGSPSKGWIQPCEFWIPSESPTRAERLCLFSASPKWATEQWWQQPPCKWGEMCREAAAACFQWVRTVLWPWVYYFYCFYWNIVYIHTYTHKHRNVLLQWILAQVLWHLPFPLLRLSYLCAALQCLLIRIITQVEAYDFPRFHSRQLFSYL